MESSQMLSVPEVYLLESDLDYEGPYDILTGLPLQEAGDTVQEASVSNESSYDYARKMFRFQAAGSAESVYASVAANMVTTQSVMIQPGEQVDVAVYRDGERLDADFSQPFAKPGKYDVIAEGSEMDMQLFSFTIVTPKTGLLNSYQMPEGFYVTGLKIDGNTQQIRQAGIVDLSAEGEYEITYKCGATGTDYHLDVKIDHTPPAITCQGVTDGQASGPVTVEGIESTDRVELLFNGETVKMPTNYNLVSPGSYELTVTDDAGNAVRESFTIQMYLNSQGLIFTIVTFVLLAALAIYVLIIRKRLRVQ